MNFAAVASEINARLATITELVATYRGPVKSISVPCTVIVYPEPIEFNLAYGASKTRVTWELLLLTGHPDAEAAYDLLGSLTDKSDPTSVVGVIESKDSGTYDLYTGCDLVKVTGCSFDVVTWQGQDFQGAIFTLDVAG